jgi:hypothetical protein
MLQIEAEHSTLTIDHSTEQSSALGDAVHFQARGAVEHQEPKHRIKRNREGDDAAGRARFSQEE